ncbi:MAG: carbon storage regulator [Deltaproteobacteria bacterium]|nr:carbon storage regulator [Deltaproteobacteria bacterium]
MNKGQIKIGNEAPKEVVIAREKVSKKENVYNMLSIVSVVNS